MSKLKIKSNKEKKLVGNKTRHYIEFIILVCCLVITFNIHPNNSNNESNTNSEKPKMIYIFHDYEGNEYILNDTIHGAAESWDYLFDDEVPSTLKGEIQPNNSASLANLNGNSDTQQTEDIPNTNIESDSKDNQISLNDIMNDLGIEDSNLINEHNNAYEQQNDKQSELIINVYEMNNSDNNNNKYTIKEETDDRSSTLIIEKQSNNSNEKLLEAKTFTYTSEGRVIPSLIPRDQLSLYKSSISSNRYIDGNKSSKTDNYIENASGVSIVNDYESCMTPWGYKIPHGDSVLAYQQMDNAPDICNIERRFCWKGKLSGTYTQQGCSINKNYTYEQRGEAEVTIKEKEQLYKTTQNSDGTVTVSDELGTGSFALDRPNQGAATNYHLTDNVRPEDVEVEQTKRAHWDCTAPWGETVGHGMFIQAFKHSNGFSDAPCEAQLRLCTNGELMGNYTESTCKTWDTSFIDWINGSPTRETYSKEKLNRVKDLINEEINYDKNLRRFSNSDELENILTILDN